MTMFGFVVIIGEEVEIWPRNGNAMANSKALGC